MNNIQIKPKKDRDEQKKFKVLKDFTLYLLFLILLSFITYFLKLTFNKKIVTFSPFIKEFLPYVYMFTYAIVAGFIIFYGLDYTDKFLTEFTFLKNKEIINLIAVSFVASFCYYYVGTTKDIIQTIGGTMIKFNTEKNVIGFVLGHLVVVCILIMMFESR